MKKDVRNNLIFVVILLVLMAPGAVILFRKKSQPGERPIGSPDPVRQTSAYMDPYPSDKVPRLAPVETLQWVAAVAMDGVNGERVTRPTAGPTIANVPERVPRVSVGDPTFFGQNPSGSAAAQVMSSGRWFQVVSRNVTPEPFVRVIVWDEDRTADSGTFSAQVGGAEARVISGRVLPLPKNIRHDLQDAGFVTPPERVTVLDIAVPGGSGDATTRAARGEQGIPVRLAHSGSDRRGQRGEKADVAIVP